MYKIIVILLLILILLTTCVGCTGIFKKNIKPEKEFICTKIDCGDENIDELVEEEKQKQNTIACIKVQPDCEW